MSAVHQQQPPGDPKFSFSCVPSWALCFCCRPRLGAWPSEASQKLFLSRGQEILGIRLDQVRYLLSRHWSAMRTTSAPWAPPEKCTVMAMQMVFGDQVCQGQAKGAFCNVQHLTYRSTFSHWRLDCSLAGAVGHRRCARCLLSGHKGQLWHRAISGLGLVHYPSSFTWHPSTRTSFSF